jgi:hypothetical protein
VAEVAVDTTVNADAVAGPNIPAANQQRYITILENGTVVVTNAASLNFSGNVTVTASGTTGANIVLSGGGGNANAAGSNSQIQYNNGGNLAGSSGLTWDNGNGILSVTGNVFASSSGSFKGNTSTGVNALYAGTEGFTALGSNVIGQFTSNVNSYAQINFENVNNGNRASTDYVLTADNGTDSTYYVDLGIAGSNHSDPAFFGDSTTANDGYLYVVGNAQTGPAGGIGNLILGSSDGVIKMFVGNTAQANVKATVDSAGLSVTGNVRGGNVLVSGIASATGNITGGNVLTAGIVSATGNITGGNISTGIITFTNGAVIKDNAGESVAFGQSAGGTSQGNSAVALGQNAGATDQGTFAVAIGRNAGQTTQGGSAVAVGVSAGDTSQGTSAVAIGSSAGFTNQSANTVAVGVGAGQSTQGVDAVAIGNSAGSLTQGIAAVAIGALAGRTFQANNSIIINATGANLDQTTANTFTVAPVRNDVANTAEVMFYNATSKEITYGNTISVAGNITGGNLLTGGSISATSTITSAANVTGGNILTGGVISATANVTGGNVLTGGVISATANVTGGNVLTAGLISATSTITSAANITGGNVLTGGLISATSTITSAANITGGNILTGGLISATANITGGNVTTAGLTSTASLSITGNTATITSANYAVGYRDIPQISLASNVTTALTDAGKHYYSTSASNLALTLADNSAVSWPVGTAISIVNGGTANILINQGTGVSMYLAGNATAGNRVLATFGMATIMNTAANVWFINGTGLT